MENTDVHRRVNGTYYERPNINGHFPYRSLGTKDKEAALAEWERREDLRKRGQDPQPKLRDGVTVGDVLRRYAKDEYPDRHRGTRPEKTRKSEAANCANLLGHWDSILVEDITLSQCDKYHDWRVKKLLADRQERVRGLNIERKTKKLNLLTTPETLEEGDGDRTVDLELNTLRNALLWSARNEVIKFLPPDNVWKRYRKSGAVAHCRDFKPADADELHKIVGRLFSPESKRAGGRSEVIGWQVLFEACTGLRTVEVLALRLDAMPDEPGWITPDGQSLCVRRAKDPENKDLNPFVQITDEIKQILQAFKKWHARKYPASPWFFPSPRPLKKSEGHSPKPLNTSAVIHAMTRISKALGKKLTSHGLRAFYVTVRRSWGVHDSQIGFEIGHEPGQTLAEVYGGVPQFWLDGKGPKMSWLPKGDAAWAVLNLD